jgi:hypothetical protein
MNERIRELIEQSHTYSFQENRGQFVLNDFAEKFAELIVQKCIDKIETHQIPVGNSAAGEMACEWTYAALKEIRDEIREHFGVEE